MIDLMDIESTDVVDERRARIVHDAIAKGKRHFGVAGASLTWMNSPRQKEMLPEGWKPKILEEAMLAEQRTSTTLRDWIKDKPSAVLIDSTHIRGLGKERIDKETGLIEGGDTDHVLIIGGAIFIIDTKNWRKKATYTVSDKGAVLRNTKTFPGGRVHIERAVHMWLDYVDPIIDDVSIKGAIYINNDDDETTRVFRGPTWYKHHWFLLEHSRFIKWMDEGYAALSDTDRNTIDPTMIAEVAQCCVKPYNRRDGLINTKALRGDR